MSDRYRCGRRLWGPEDDALVVARYPHESTSTLARELRRTPAAVFSRAQLLGAKKTEKYLASPAAHRLRGGDERGRATRFQKGHVPANKGLRRPGYGPGRMKETQFKKGARSGVARKNWRPVGTIARGPDGYLRIKVREAKHGQEPFGFGNVKVWPLLQRHVWSEAHGPVPPGHAICFKDGNRENCDLENLECIPRRELMARNAIHRLPKPLTETIQLLGALNRQIRRRSSQNEKQDRRLAKSPI